MMTTLLKRLWAVITTKPKPHRIVFHLATGDPLAYRSLVGQLNNVLTYWPTAALEVVIHNRGIGFVRRDESAFEQAIQALCQKGVVFAVCTNTMKQHGLTDDQVFAEVIFVPVALAELALKQEAGWSYIKAGF